VEYKTSNSNMVSYNDIRFADKDARILVNKFIKGGLQVGGE
jgi:hypothetical protein